MLEDAEPRISEENYAEEAFEDEMSPEKIEEVIP